MYRIYRAVIVIDICAWRIRVTFMFSVHYFKLRICDFTNVMMFLYGYLNLAEVGDGNIEGTARLHVHDSFER